jgi:hypothetical protein
MRYAAVYKSDSEPLASNLGLAPPHLLRGWGLPLGLSLEGPWSLPSLSPSPWPPDCAARDDRRCAGPAMNSRRLVCRERSMVRGDGGSVMTVSPPRPEARSRLGFQTASELGAPVASSIPEQLHGHEPASARKGYEDGNALVLRN